MPERLLTVSVDAELSRDLHRIFEPSKRSAPSIEVTFAPSAVKIDACSQGVQHQPSRRTSPDSAIIARETEILRLINAGLATLTIPIAVSS